jgi:hypothetical protein
VFRAPLPGDLFRFIRIVRFGGPLLEKEGGEDDVEPHLQELAFPILTGCLPEVPAGKIPPVVDQRFAVNFLIVIEDVEAGHRLCGPQSEEHHEQHQRKPVVPQKALHGEPPISRPKAWAPIPARSSVNARCCATISASTMDSARSSHFPAMPSVNPAAACR